MGENAGQGCRPAPSRLYWHLGFCCWKLSGDSRALRSPCTFAFTFAFMGVNGGGSEGVKKGRTGLKSPAGEIFRLCVGVEVLEEGEGFVGGDFFVAGNVCGEGEVRGVYHGCHWFGAEIAV